MNNIKGILVAISLFLVSSIACGQAVPYSTNKTHLTIWNGTEYIPFFIKGTNLGVSVPGTFPGELAATKADYQVWLEQIQAAGFNCIRLYTLHYPRFYEVLDSFNLANPNHPLLIIQGVWLNEELPGYANDLTFMTDTFTVEIQENVDCIHGNRFIPERQGKASGTYQTDVSKWCLAYIIGREVHPEEILTTDANHPAITTFSGTHFGIENASAAEVWFTDKLDKLVTYEQTHYQTQRPVSISSWPTLDPITHAEEPNTYEDTAFIDLSKIVLKDAPAGLFVSYHAYPYYPDFVSQQSSYLPYADELGLNSYMGYLTELKAHYPNFPLIIAEYGVPSSWGVAHYATSSMNHGGFDEVQQGTTNMRILKTIQNTNCGGGIHFAWIDEWFKRTWITDPLDYESQNRVLWHNITSAEQNYGLVSFHKTNTLQTVAQFDVAPNDISKLKAAGNETFLELELGLKQPLAVADELWIALDTYADNLGESILPNNALCPFRSEFALQITNYSAKLYVTEAYDTYGIWHKTSAPEQKFQSIATDGKPWKIVRWKNNSGPSDVQYIGNLQVNHGFQNASSKDAVTIYDDKIAIRLPWTLINCVAPNALKMLHDNKATTQREDTVSDGINMGVYYNSNWYTTNQRFAWSTWNSINHNDVTSNIKTSYYIMQEQLKTTYNTPAIAMRDSFEFNNESYPITVNSNEGLLMNDWDLDGSTMVALVVDPPKNGHIDIQNDGSFVYTPYADFNGLDSVRYCVYDGTSLSESNLVMLSVSGNNTGINTPEKDHDLFTVYPNPAHENVTIETGIIFDELALFDSKGQCISTLKTNNTHYSYNVSQLSNGVYLLVGRKGNTYYSYKLIKN